MERKKANFGVDMTANFNKIIAPLKNFRLSGMLWYQGESDVAWQYGRYTRAFDALQDSYTEYFNHKNGDLPIVFSQLASYLYDDLTILQNTNFEFANIQKSRPDSRALTSILDVPLDYTVENHAIHPLCKKEVGDKMFYAAMGLVYGKYDTYTAPTPSQVKIENGSVYITFTNVGDSLLIDGDKIKGFSICGSDGIYVSAKAELISDNTVRVYSSSVPAPKSAAYAYSQSNGNANLFACVNGEKKFAVSPFVTDMNYGAHHWHNDSWTTCDYENFWHCHTNEYTGFYNTWKATGATISFAESEIDSGNALYVTSSAGQFTISPDFLYTAGGADAFFQDVDFNWSDYGTLTFKIKVQPGQTVRFDGLKLQLNDSIWFSPAIKDTNLVGCVIDGDGKVHSVTLDMNRLYVYANTATNPYDSGILTAVTSADFVFTGISSSNVSFCVDDFAFSSVDLVYEKPDNNQLYSPSFLEKIKAFFLNIYTKIVLFFERLF